RNDVTGVDCQLLALNGELHACQLPKLDVAGTNPVARSDVTPLPNPPCGVSRLAGSGSGRPRSLVIYHTLGRRPPLCPASSRSRPTPNPPRPAPSHALACRASPITSASLPAPKAGRSTSASWASGGGRRPAAARTPRRPPAPCAPCSTSWPAFSTTRSGAAATP